MGLRDAAKRIRSIRQLDREERQAASRACQDFGPPHSKTVLSGWKAIQADQNPSTISIPFGISKSKCLVFES